jgi:hypothetical protein
MSLRVALDFADNPRPYPSLAAPADTNGELYRALKVIASAYRAALTAEKVAAEPVRTHPCRCGVCAEATDMIEQQAEDLKSASERLTLVASINASYVQEIHALRSRVATLKAAVDAQPTYLPCPICNGVEGCDHPFPERRRAAEKPIYQQRAAGFNAAWRDVSKECFDECSAIDTFETRIVYAAPQQPAQSAEQDEAAAYLVRGLDGYNEEYASVWIKRANADAAAAAIFRASITPLVVPSAASTQSTATQPAQTEVAAFEAWASENGLNPKIYTSKLNPGGAYGWAMKAWQARALLAAQPVSGADK